MASILQVQVNQIDHYVTRPGPLDNSESFQVPVIRVYGSSSAGVNCCVHVHQVYPYFFVEYDGKLRIRHVNRYIHKLKHSLNHSIALSLKRDLDSYKPDFVRSIILVKGRCVHFYGFHSAYSPFLKVYINDPAFYNRAVTIMRSGSVLRTHFRIFESHLSFTLQFMADFGLYGCGTLELSHVLQREQTRSDDDEDVPNAAGCHILNRHRIGARNIHHKLVITAPGPPTLPSEPLVLSVRELWDDERKRRIARGQDPSPEMPKDPSESSRSARSEWVAEARWWQQVHQRIEAERSLVPTPQTQNDWENWVMTTFESIEALWEDPWRIWKPVIPAAHEAEALEGDPEPEEDIDIDESFSADHLSQLVQKEAEWQRELNHDSPPPEEQDGEEDLGSLLEEESDPDSDDDKVKAESMHRPCRRGIIIIEASVTDHRWNVFLSHATVLLIWITSPHSKIRPLPRGDPSSQDVEALQLTGNSPTRSPSFDVTSEPPQKKRRLETSRMSFPTGRIAAHKAMTIVAGESKRVSLNQHIYSLPAPSVLDLTNTLDTFNIATKLYQSPYYSIDADVPDKPREYGGFIFHLAGSSDTTEYLDEWQGHQPVDNDYREPTDVFPGGWEYAKSPPSARQVKNWLLSERGKTTAKRRGSARSQIEGPTMANIYGLKTLAVKGDTVNSVREKQSMTILALEVYAPSLKHPSSETDAIVAAFYAFQDGNSSVSRGMVMTSDQQEKFASDVTCVTDELDLLNHIVDLVLKLDPDILTGWEIQTSSWGYLNARAGEHGLDIIDLLNRAPSKQVDNQSQWDVRHTSTFKIVGRHVLNLWRVMRVEITLNTYSFENVVFHVLHQRIPKYNSATLRSWYQDSVFAHKAKVFAYFLDRTFIVLRLLDETEVITKTAEFARVFGVDFFSVLSRGSQFKVESFMFRIAKPESFVLLSPSKQDVGRQNAAEAMPLIMEPQSAFYTSPTLVLDFQSLYPSIMIANNYCYSTFLGRIQEFQGRQKFGVTDLDLRPGVIEQLKEHIIGECKSDAPTGMMFVKPQVRQGLLGRMLVELLDTRVMVKQAMKGIRNDKALKRVLDARQLGLKFIANVTYGYTSASFSGRMPAVEIADCIVQSGRETLERAIDTINRTEKWGAQVVYGDTDSVFVLSDFYNYNMNLTCLKKLARENERSSVPYWSGNRRDDNPQVKDNNPVPIKLKFEKVYLPCVLLAKKRYVGFKYEHPDDVEPVFDAKGIETVRRDGVLAQRKMTETCLKMLFRTQDLSEIKDYCYRSWAKLLEGKASVEDFTFAKEVRMGTYSNNGPPPPGVALAAKQAVIENREPQYSERVPYVISTGPPDSRLVDRVVAPLDILRNRHLHLDADYYITRVLIPPLDRILSLTGADVRKWYMDMPRPKSVDAQLLSPSKAKAAQIEDNGNNIYEHFYNSVCVACEAPAYEGPCGAAVSQIQDEIIFSELCSECSVNPQRALPGILFKIRKGEKRVLEAHQVCGSCSNSPAGDSIECESLDCSWMYRRTKAVHKLDFLENLARLLEADI
ncbi:unnamed protein product [Mycena citricolor]|uniref:DNA polymerase n=1 Tax=Mycena citricolor TaxID=2018698 RepID=A0AAD2GV01_9AGAR|nr:unnamed protein product [Mycena citricolor]